MVTVSTEVVSPTAESSSGASQRPLRELGAAGKLGSFLVQVHSRHVEEYTYTRQGQSVEGQRLLVLFLSEHEGEYVTARMTVWRGKKAELDAAASRFKPGLHFHMSEVSSFSQEQSCYISSPIKVVVDLRQTKFLPVLQGLHPAFTCGPPTTLADILQLPDGRQRFDLTAVARIAGEHREVTTKFGQRIAQDIVLRDGSNVSSSSSELKPAEIQTALFFASHAEHSAFLAAQTTDPVFTFFSLDMQKVAEEVTVTPAVQGFHYESAACSRGAALREAVAAETVWANSGISLTTDWQPQEGGRDYSATPARFSLCAFLAMHQKHDTDYVHEVLFQLNHVHVPLPPKVVLFEERLFWSTRIRDFSGSVDVAIRQKAACQLGQVAGSGTDAAQTFAAQHADGTLPWPLLTSVKILATVKDSTGTQDAESMTSAKKVRFIVVEANEQDLKQLPTQHMLNTLLTLNCLPVPQDGMLAARLIDLYTNSFGVFQVDASPITMNTVAQGSNTAAAESRSAATAEVHGTWHLSGGKRRRVNCSKALVLLQSTQKTQVEAIDDSNRALRLMTKGVTDALHPDTSGGVFSVIAYCDQRDLKDFILDPPRTGTRVQHALALVTAKNVNADNGIDLIVEQLQLVNDNDASVVQLTMRRLWALANAAAGRIDPSQPVKWGEADDGTMHQPMCIELGSYPPGAVLNSPTKTANAAV